MIIYKAQNKINGKIYIGQTQLSLQDRMRVHRSCRKTYFGLAIKKYGYENFDVCAIDTASSKEELSQKEVFWIKHFGCMSPAGYNRHEGGKGGWNKGKKAARPKSEATRLLLSKALKGKKRGPSPWLAERNRLGHSMETRRKLSEIRKSLPSFRIGTHHSDESKLKMSLAKKGKPWSAERRAAAGL